MSINLTTNYGGLTLKNPFPRAVSPAPRSVSSQTESNMVLSEDTDHGSGIIKHSSEV